MHGRLVGCVLAVLTALGTLAVAEPASAAGTPLPLTYFSDILADGHGHVFVTGGSGSTEVVVADRDGEVQQTLPDLPGAAGMALSDDGDQLYVALSDAHAIAVVDTSDLGVRRLMTGEDTCPATVAVAAGLVWYGYRCYSEAGSAADLGAVDPVTGANHPHLGAHRFIQAPLLAASPRRPNRLVAGTPLSSPSSLTVLRVTGGDEPAAETLAESRETGGNLESVAVTPDGADLVVADGAVYHHQLLSADDLSVVGGYQTTPYPNAVAVAEDGLVAAGVFGWYSPDVYLFGPEGPPRAVEIGDTEGRTLQDDGLAFGNGRLYAVTADVYDHDPELVVLDRGAIDQSSGEPAPDPQPTPEPAPDPVGASLDALPGSPADLSPAPRPEPRTPKATARVTTSVRPGYRTSGRYAVYHRGRPVRAVASLAPLHAGRCVHFRGQRLTRHGWRTFVATPCVATGSHGRAAHVFGAHTRAGDRIRLRAEWRGDASTAPGTSRWRYARHTR